MSKWILCFQSEKVSGVAESYFRLKRQLPTQFRKELCARAGLSNNESACSADVHNITGLQANEAMSITKRYFTSLFSMRS